MVWVVVVVVLVLVVAGVVTAPGVVVVGILVVVVVVVLTKQSFQFLVTDYECVFLLTSGSSIYLCREMKRRISSTVHRSIGSHKAERMEHTWTRAAVRVRTVKVRRKPCERCDGYEPIHLELDWLRSSLLEVGVLLFIHEYAPDRRKCAGGTHHSLSTT